MQRVEQKFSDDCANAVISMLTPLEWGDITDTYGSPCWEEKRVFSILRGYWAIVNSWSIDSKKLEQLARANMMDAAYVVVQSPISKYDEDKYWDVAVQNESVDVRHAVAVRGTDLYDPSPHRYWDTLRGLRKSECEVTHAYLLRGELYG